MNKKKAVIKKAEVNNVEVPCKLIDELKGDLGEAEKMQAKLMQEHQQLVALIQKNELQGVRIAGLIDYLTKITSKENK